MKRLLMILATVTMATAFVSCKSAGKKDSGSTNPVNNTYTGSNYAQTNTPTTPTYSATSVVGNRYVLPQACSTSIIAKVTDRNCVDEITFTDASNVTMKFGGQMYTTTYTINSNIVSVSFKDMVTIDGRGTFGFGSLQFTAAVDFSTLTDAKARILSRQ